MTERGRERERNKHVARKKLRETDAHTHRITLERIFSKTGRT